MSNPIILSSSITCLGITLDSISIKIETKYFPDHWRKMTDIQIALLKAKLIDKKKIAEYNKKKYLKKKAKRKK